MVDEAATAGRWGVWAPLLLVAGCVCSAPAPAPVPEPVPEPELSHAEPMPVPTLAEADAWLLAHADGVASACQALRAGSVRFVVVDSLGATVGKGGSSELGTEPADEHVRIDLISGAVSGSEGDHDRTPLSWVQALPDDGIVSVNLALQATFSEIMCAYHGCWGYEPAGCEVRTSAPVDGPVWAAPWFQVGGPSLFPSASCERLATSVPRAENRGGWIGSRLDPETPAQMSDPVWLCRWTGSSPGSPKELAATWPERSADLQRLADFGRSTLKKGIDSCLDKPDCPVFEDLPRPDAHDLAAAAARAGIQEADRPRDTKAIALWTPSDDGPLSHHRPYWWSGKAPPDWAPMTSRCVQVVAPEAGRWGWWACALPAESWPPVWYGPVPEP